MTNAARTHHERISAQQRVLAHLRSQPLRKSDYERWNPGSRLAPVIDKLRNCWGFNILGDGSYDSPYEMAFPYQMPEKVSVTDDIKRAYYETDHWQRMRHQRLTVDGYHCVICGAIDDLNVHHIKYQLFEEEITELMTVCRFHHGVIHDNSRMAFPCGLSVDQCRKMGLVFEFPDWVLP